MENVKEYLENCGAYLHHVGMLSEDNAKTEKMLSKMIGIGEWVRDSSDWTEENMVVGPANSICCSNAKIWGGINLELVQPIHGKADGTHFEEYLKEHGTGLHHLCYMFQSHESFLKSHAYMTEQGCKDVHHGKLFYEDGELFVEFCYLEVIPDGLYLELNFVNQRG